MKTKHRTNTDTSILVRFLFLGSDGERHFLAFLFEKLTNFIKQLHSSKPKGLLGSGKYLKMGITISSENKKANNL